MRERRDPNDVSSLHHLLDAELRPSRAEVEAELESLIKEAKVLRSRGTALPNEHEWIEPWKFASWRHDLDRWLERTTQVLANAFTTNAVARDFIRVAALDEQPFPTPFDALMSFGNSLSAGLNKLISIYQRLDLFREGASASVAPGDEAGKAFDATSNTRWASWSQFKRSAIVIGALLAAGSSAAAIVTFFFAKPWRGHDQEGGTNRAGVTTIPSRSSGLGGATTSCTVMSSIEGGDIYRVRNVTHGTAFGDPTSAGPDDVVAFAVRISNPGPCVRLKEVMAQAVFGTAPRRNTSVMTIQAPNASPSSTSDSATVILPRSLTPRYIPGSTHVTTTAGKKDRRLRDGIVDQGIVVGDVGVNIADTLIVEFRMRVEA